MPRRTEALWPISHPFVCRTLCIIANLAIMIATNGAHGRPSPQPQSPSMTNGKPLLSFSDMNTEITSETGSLPQTISSKDPKVAAQAAGDLRNIVRRKLTGYVGFANLPNQWHRKSVRKGFNFNVMVVGKCRNH